jgi:hypothetical protein
MNKKLFLATFLIRIDPYQEDPIIGTKTQCRIIRAGDVHEAREKLRSAVERYDTYEKDITVINLEITECIE